MLLNELLNIKYPIIQGAMANISDGLFAAKVSNAGALGVIASGSHDSNWVEEQILIAKENTNKPFAVNVMMLSPYADSIFDVIIKNDVKIVTTGAGFPTKHMKSLVENNIKVIPVIASVAMAKRAERYGAFAVVAEGTESGGHVGEETTLVLVKAVKDEINIPVIAAGGIATGSQFNAALSLGAIGIQAGTIFLASKECNISDEYKNIIIKAKDIDTVVTGRSLSAPVRVYRNKMAKYYLELEREIKSRLELEKLTIGSLEKAIKGDTENGSLMMGMDACLIKEIKSIEDILKDLMKELKESKKELDLLFEKSINNNF